MADGKPIEQKVREVLLADAPFVALLATDANSNPALYLGKVSPVGVRYPAVNVVWSSGKSEEKITAEYGMIRFYITQDKESTEQYARFIEFRDAILRIFNRNPGQPLTEISVPLNEGIRVVSILKTEAQFDFSDRMDKFQSIVQFKVVKGEDEDFTTDYGTWTCS
jgi:hypothetical protein